jgi:hypothetical protein
LYIIYGTSSIGLIYPYLCPFGLREVVGSLAGVVFSSASGKGNSISFVVKCSAFRNFSIFFGELVNDFGLLSYRLTANAYMFVSNNDFLWCISSIILFC